MQLNGLQITWLGHGTFKLVTPGGRRLLIDPWVQNNPACPENQKQVGKLDAILITHGHFDHINDAITLARESQPDAVVGIFELCHWLTRKGVANCRDMNKGGTQEVAGIKVTMVHADHSCGITDGDQILYGGEAVGYVLEFENGLKAYHAGDTAVFGDMRIIGELYHPDLAFLPIGDHYTMSPREAAYACRLLQPRAVIPMHYATFPLLKGTPAALREELQKLGLEQIEVLELQPGQTLS
jgi:L-ascorbate metabolism protein UlaG (beta-lactamase superfamily)